jgi:hypothetical protein
MHKARLLLLCVLGLWLSAKTQAGYTTPALEGARKILFLGDSLTVGPFGREMQSFLCEQVSERRVYIYASCGASPENWLDEEPPYVSKCGFRVKTPSSFLLGEFEKGSRPKPFSTPKLTPLLTQIHPTTVIVQMGTNWFDLLERQPGPDEITRLGSLLESFADAIQSAPGRPTLIWITPPDSSRFRAVQGSVTKLLTTTGRRKRFTVIDSSGMVRYQPGQSGGDGVHYFGADAAKWADGVKKRLRNLL